MKVKLLDNTCSHEPLFYSTKNQDKIEIIKNGTIEKEDLVIYTNSFFPKVEKIKKHRNCKNIAYLCESYEGELRWYDWIKKNNHLFDIVLTWNKELLEMNPEKFKLQLFGTTWIPESERKIHQKSKLSSIIVSNSRSKTGHKLRHMITDYLLQNKSLVDIDFFGRRFGNLPPPQSIGSETVYSLHHPSNRKVDALKDYMFTICILPSKVDYEFDEKLIDSFLTGTVPIFWGCPCIGKFFNTQGMLIFNTFEECIELLKKITKEMYFEMLPHIEDNFERAKKYTHFRFNEEEILKLA